MQKDTILLVSLDGPALENLEKRDGEEAWLASADGSKICMIKKMVRKKVCVLLLSSPILEELSIVNMLR